MRTWDIGKLIMDNCNSPEDVGQVIEILRDPAAIEEVCSLIAAFSDYKHSDYSSKTTAPTVQSVASHNSHAGAHKTPSSTTRRRPTDSFKLDTAVQLETIFRTKGMTNQQVEQWIKGNFEVRVTLSKDSLRNYLTKVLNHADLGLSNRLLAAARRLAKENSKATSDIRAHWDELDKRFPVTE